MISTSAHARLTFDSREVGVMTFNKNARKQQGSRMKHQNKVAVRSSLKLE